MDIIKAREIVRTLADGIDPTTGEVLPEESVYTSPEVIRALFSLLEATEPKVAMHIGNAGMPWTEEEDERLRCEYFAGMKSTAIAKAHGRTRGAIVSRLKHLSLK